MVWLVVGAGIVVIVVAVLLSRARVPHDGVDNFRRQIDALSPEARRPVVGRVNEARQATRDHGLTVRRVNAVTPAKGIDASKIDRNAGVEPESNENESAGPSSDLHQVTESNPGSRRPDSNEDRSPADSAGASDRTQNNVNDPQANRAETGTADSDGAGNAGHGIGSDHEHDPGHGGDSGESLDGA